MAKLSFQILDITSLGATDSAGSQRMIGHFTVFFTSGRVLARAELQGPVQVESPPGTPRTLGAIQLDVFAAIRAEASRLDAIDARPLTVSAGTLPLLTPAILATRYDATNATPTQIAPVDVPPPDSTPPRL